MGANLAASIVIDNLAPTQHAFLIALTECGSITRAAAAVGIERQSHYDWLERERAHGYQVDGEEPTGPYASACLRAKRIAADKILERSQEYALEGVGMPATIERIFHIKRWYPEYRDQLTVKSTSINLTARVDLNQLDTSERLELLNLTKRRMELLTQQGGDVADGSSDVGDGGG